MGTSTSCSHISTNVACDPYTFFVENKEQPPIFAVPRPFGSTYISYTYIYCTGSVICSVRVSSTRWQLPVDDCWREVYGTRLPLRFDTPRPTPAWSTRRTTRYRRHCRVRFQPRCLFNHLLNPSRPFRISPRDP